MAAALCVRIATAGLLWAGLSVTALAAEDIQGVQLHWDNDVWAQGGADRWYTNGLRLSWSWNAEASTALGKGLDLAARWWLWDGATPTLTYAFGQSMYTPGNIRTSAAQPFDRPWGAFLFTGVTAHDYRGREFRATEFKLGFTGRHAQGERAQAGVHRYLTHSARPEGWDQQLGTRLGLQLSHTRLRLLGDTKEGDVFGFQTSWGGAIGTLRTYGHLGLAMTVGNLVGSNSPLSVANEGDFVIQDFENRDQFKRPFGYVAVSVTAMAYNYFLQGRAPHGRAQIDRRPWVAAVQVGASLPLHCWTGWSWMPRVVYSQTLRGPEFTSRLQGAPSTRSRYGSFTLHWDQDR